MKYARSADFCADRIDVITNFAVITNVVIRRLHLVCMDKYLCRHLIGCEECAQTMKKCPICGKRIKGQLKTFMS